MDLNDRKNVMLNILHQYPGMGKTAMMKVIFLLQQVKDMSLDYDFSIYTYGPYTAEVAEEVNDLIFDGLVASEVCHYPNYVGYSLKLTEKGERSINPLDSAELAAIQDILSFTKDKSAKDLELYSTIVYIDNLYTKNSWSKGAEIIIEKVKEIKPHFLKQKIAEAFDTLNQFHYLTP